MRRTFLFALAISLAACSGSAEGDPSSTPPPTEDGATSLDAGGDAPVVATDANPTSDAVAPPDASASPGYPHQPTGFTMFMESMTDTKPPFPGGPVSGWTGTWYYSAGGLNFSTIADPSAPQAPQNVIIERYPANLIGGTGPVNWGGWGAPKTQEYDDVYISYWTYIDGTGPNGAYQQNSVGTKMVFIAYGADANGGQNQGIAMLMGNGTDLADVMNGKIEFRQQGTMSGAMNWRQNVDPTPRMQVQKWHHLEYHFKANTGACTLNPTFSYGGSTFTNVYTGDGVVELWIDDVKVMAHTSLCYKNAATGDNHGFNLLKFNPTFGGGGPPRSRADEWRVNHVYGSHG